MKKFNTNNFRDIITVNVNVFEGDLLLCDSYVQDVGLKHLKQLSKTKLAFSFSPESMHIDQLGFKLCTIFRLRRISSLTVFIKSGNNFILYDNSGSRGSRKYRI